MVASLLVMLVSSTHLAIQDAWDNHALAQTVQWPVSVDACPQPPPEPATTATRPHQCAQFRQQRLGNHVDAEWYQIRYRRTVFMSNRGPSDSVDFDEVIIVKRAGESSIAEMTAHFGRDRRYEFIQDVVWTETEIGPVLELQFCLNGTGGCIEWYYRRISNAWLTVAQTFATELARHVPQGYRLHKGRVIDLSAMRGSWPLSGPDDPNCCPSGQIDFTLTWADGALELVRVLTLRIPDRAVQ